MTDAKILNRVRGWLGYGDPSDVSPHHEQSQRHAPDQPCSRANLGLIDEISDFHHAHGLGVTSDSLAFAYDLITGSDPRLAGLVSRRLRDRLPIDGEWIEQTRKAACNDDSLAITTLRERLEKSIRDFSQTTRDARSATSDYQNVLQVHVDELGAVNKAGEVITELANVAKAMLDRTRDIEDRMAKSERETRQLQRRLEEAKRSAEVDHLTGLPNRRAFEGVLEKEYAEAKRSRDALSVAFCDIDKFKLINDVHGHDAGDRVLKLVARILSEISDDRCHVARHGGEEFVVAFRGKTAREAQRTLDETRESLCSRKLVNRATDTPFGTVSFSAGVADVFAYADTRAALKAADEALYLAKEHGRNRIELAVSSAESAPAHAAR
ncbi:MAG: diguanylate cyclase [Novosphingobium sp.]